MPSAKSLQGERSRLWGERERFLAVAGAWKNRRTSSLPTTTDPLTTVGEKGSIGATRPTPVDQSR